LPRAEYEVVVVAHEAEGNHVGIKPVHGFSDDFQQRMTVVVIFENGLTTVTSGGDVVDRTREFNSQRSGHGGRLGFSEV